MRSKSETRLLKASRTRSDVKTKPAQPAIKFGTGPFPSTHGLVFLGDPFYEMRNCVSAENTDEEPK
jgi:hypothetical protein